MLPMMSSHDTEKTQERRCMCEPNIDITFCRSRHKNKKENSTKRYKTEAQDTLPIIFRSFWILGALFICDLCAHDVDLD